MDFQTIPEATMMAHDRAQQRVFWPRQYQFDCQPDAIAAENNPFSANDAHIQNFEIKIVIRAWPEVRN